MSLPGLAGQTDWALGRTFEWNGASVRWDTFGDGDPVVFCHGTPWSSYVWRHSATRIAEHRRVFVWDMVGYGQSDKPDADVSLATQGRVFAALLDHWGLAAPDVIAHDFGGAVALRAMLLHGVRFRSLALVDVVALRPWGSPFFNLVADHPEVFAALPPNLHEALVREYISDASNQGLEPHVLDSLVAPWTGPDGQPAFYRQIAHADEAHTDEIEPRYSAMDIPTLIVWGTDDTWIPAERAERLHAMIPGSRLELVGGAGHLIQEDRPETLAGLLTEWLASGSAT